MGRIPGRETQVFAWRCCCHRRRSQEVAHFTKRSSYVLNPCLQCFGKDFASRTARAGEV